MSHRDEDNDSDDEELKDDPENPDDSDMDDSDDPEVIPCPHCGKPISEESDWCHYCGNFTSAESTPVKVPRLLIAGTILGLLAMLACVLILLRS